MATSNDWLKLREARDYREFLSLYLQEKGQSLSDLARAAGFNRGFPGEVLAGKRRLTAKSSALIEKALKLPVSGKKMFRLLVAFEESDVFPEIDRAEIPQGLRALRERPWMQARRNLRTREAPQLQRVFQDPAAIAVFAAAGQPGQGASWSQIQQRTCIEAGPLRAAIASLVKVGLLQEKDADRWVPQDLHLLFQNSDVDQVFVSLFQRACQRAQQRIPRAVQSEQEMFFSSSFCIDEKRLPELKKILREIILKFVDESIEADGDRVVNMVTSLHL